MAVAPVYSVSKKKHIVLSNRARRIYFWTSFIFLFVVILVQYSMNSNFNNINNDWDIYHNNRFIVNQINDGDTIYLALYDKVARRSKTRVRLIGIDTPELETGISPSMPFAEKARDYVTQLCLNKEVIIKLEPNRSCHRDKYKRLLAYIYLTEEQMLNEKLISEGYGWADIRHDHLYDKRFEKLYKIARKNKTGLWALSDPKLPGYLEE